MVLPRSAALRGTVRSFSFRRAGTQARTTLRGVGRRTYASEHGATKSSDIPWLIGAIVVTVPAAGWLWQQGPTKSDHGHDHNNHEEKHEEEESKEDEPKEESVEESGDKEESKEEGSKEESNEEGESESKDEGNKGSSEGDAETPEISEKETTKGSLSEEESRITEKKGDKDAQKDVSASNHPDLADAAKSKKPEGVAETAKIHGTVDSSRPTKGHKDPSESQ